MSGPEAGGCCSSPRSEVGMPDEIQDAQLYLNFRETKNNFFYYMCIPNITYDIFVIDLKFKFSWAFRIFIG